MEETALSSFLSGFATAYFALQAYQLFRRENSSRLQRVVAIIFVQWALFNLKDFLLTVHDYHNQNVHDILVMIDGTSLIGYTIKFDKLFKITRAEVDEHINSYNTSGYVMPASMSIISETTTLTSIRQIFPGYAWWLGSSSPVNCFGSSSLSSAIR